MRPISHFPFAVPILALAMLASTNMASAQNTETVELGRTTVTFASDILPALGGLGINLGTVGPSRLVNGVVTFPVTGGAIDLDTGVAQVIHSGGLTLTSGQSQVTLQSFIVDTSAAIPVITGLVSVNGTLLGRLPIFDLSLTGGLTLPLTPQTNGQLTIAGVDLTLDSAAAATLNSAFSTSALTGGSEIGTATIMVILSGVAGN